MLSIRRSTLTLALVAFSALSAFGAPAITPGGISNAASFLPGDVPGGGIAQGSFFSGFGTEMGPEDGVENESLPLPTELGGVQVTVSSGEQSWDAYLTFVRADQFNAVMPSEVPVGEVEITVTFNGETSEPATAMVVAIIFGIFSATGIGAGPGIVTNFVSDSERPVNSNSVTAQPGQVVTIWGTGLMGMPGADAEAPLDTGNVRDLQGEVQVSVLVGGSPVSNILYAGRSAEFPGLDQISVELPADVTTGCFVPVLVMVNGMPSNEGTIAISSDGSACADGINPLSTSLIDGQRLAALASVRLGGNIALSAALMIDFTLDVFAGSFSDQVGGDFAYNRFFSLPPVGSCSRQTFTGIDLLALLGGEFPDLNFGAELDAGPSLTLMRDGGNEIVVPQDPMSVGRYVETVGGGLSLTGGETDPPYFEPGEFTITSEGGAEVGPLDVTFTIPERPAWLNRDAFSAAMPINRSQELAFAWEAGDPAAPQIMLALAAHVNIVSGSASGFVCLMPQTTGGFTVSPALLSTMPASTPPSSTGTPTSLGFVGLGSLPVIEPFEAEGLDLGVAIAATLELQSVTLE